MFFVIFGNASVSNTSGDFFVVSVRNENAQGDVGSLSASEPRFSVALGPFWLLVSIHVCLLPSSVITRKLGPPTTDAAGDQPS